MPTERRFRMRWQSLTVPNLRGQSTEVYTERFCIDFCIAQNAVDAGHFSHWYVDADYADAPEPVALDGMLWS